MAGKHALDHEAKEHHAPVLVLGMDDKLPMPHDPLVSGEAEHMDDVAAPLPPDDEVNVFRTGLVQLVQDGHEGAAAGYGGEVGGGKFREEHGE